jgi:hypothetical protein
MGWTAYRLVYQAKSPIHIGWHTLGYIKLTRYYITGKSMWGAMTANLVRACYGYEDYDYVGNLLCSGILISYFYPALDPDFPLLPRYTEKGLKYGGCTESEFEGLFIKSYGQTAVLPESNTAEDESLHESEFIAPVIEDEYTKEQMPVYFVGYVFIGDSLKKKDDETLTWNGKDIKLREIVSEIFVGGDRKYGWGRMVLNEENSKNTAVTHLFDNELILDKAELKVKILSGKPIPAHLSINSDIRLKGDIEPLVGREWGEVIDREGNKKIGSGQRISDAAICWMPGSILEKPKGITLPIGPYGILKQR